MGGQFPLVNSLKRSFGAGAMPWQGVLWARVFVIRSSLSFCNKMDADEREKFLLRRMKRPVRASPNGKRIFGRQNQLAFLRQQKAGWKRALNGVWTIYFCYINWRFCTGREQAWRMGVPPKQENKNWPYLIKLLILGWRSYKSKASLDSRKKKNAFSLLTFVRV